jgi:hypothetical protein
MSSINKQAKMNVIKQIAQENNYNESILNRKRNSSNRQELNETRNTLGLNSQNNNKWVKFTYTGKETRYITKLFKGTDVKIAFRTNNSIKNVLKPKPTNEHSKYNLPGVYKLKCKDCPLQYIGQTGRSFNTRYKEHIRAIRYNKETSGYAKHILNSGHSYGSIEDTLDIIKIETKGKHLDTLEKFHIFCLVKQNKHLNDSNIETHNPIFNVIYKHSGYNTHE